MKFLTSIISLTAVFSLCTASPIEQPVSELLSYDSLLSAVYARNELASRASTALNTSREYYLKTELKRGQPGKTRFDNLYLYSYHTGAGLGDAVLNANRSVAVKGFLNSTKAITGPSGRKFSNQEFDLGTEFPWELVPALNTAFYAAWQPVRLNAGGGKATQSNGFFINGTGLQWSDSPKSAESQTAFGGWIVCAWWHPSLFEDSERAAPQLFFRVAYYNDVVLPTSCADVYLIPEYI